MANMTRSGAQGSNQLRMIKSLCPSSASEAASSRAHAYKYAYKTRGYDLKDYHGFRSALDSFSENLPLVKRMSYARQFSLSQRIDHRGAVKIA